MQKRKDNAKEQPPGSAEPIFYFTARVHSASPGALSASALLAVALGAWHALARGGRQVSRRTCLDRSCAEHHRSVSFLWERKGTDNSCCEPRLGGLAPAMAARFYEVAKRDSNGLSRRKGESDESLSIALSHDVRCCCK